jgi:hypothetical protein
MNTTMDKFNDDGGSDKFEGAVADSLGIEKSSVKVIELKSGSVIVDYNIYVNEYSGFTLDEL